MPAPIVITADEINCLIHSYFQDSGFHHSAFAVRVEGCLENSINFRKYVPRGELVELLSKALLYLEVEAHWKADAMTANCKTGFSLLDPHVCSLEPPLPVANPPPPVPLEKVSEPASKANGLVEAPSKRKASTPSTDDGRTDKRQKREGEEALASGSTARAVSSKPNPTPKQQPQEAPPSPKKPKAKRVVRSGEEAPDSTAVGLLRGHKREVFNCAWNPVKRNLLATGSKDGTVNIWDVPRRLKHQSTSHDPPIYLFNTPKEEDADVTAVHWNSDGSLLAIGSYDATLRIYTSSGALYFTGASHTGPIFAIQFSPSDAWILTASLDGMTCVWDVRNKKLHKKLDSHEGIQPGLRDQGIRLIRGNPDCVLDVEWLDDSNFVTCGSDGLIHIMNMGEPKPIKVLGGHKSEVDVNQIELNPSGTRLASCSDDLTARIWSVSKSDLLGNSFDPTGMREVVVLRGHTGSICGMGWSAHNPPGTHEILATSSFDKTVRIWDSVTGECLKVFTDHRRPVYTLCFSPDGLWLATGGGDGYLYVYNVRTLAKKYTWFLGSEKPGIYEIKWQQAPGMNRIALALENHHIGIVDVTKIPSLQNPVL